MKQPPLVLQIVIMVLAMGAAAQHAHEYGRVSVYWAAGTVEASVVVWAEVGAAVADC